MRELFQSAPLWAIVVGVAALAALAIELLFRSMLSRSARQSAHYPNRVGTELPRILPKKQP